MAGFPFVKMHGLGNDFVILDQRHYALEFGPAEAQRLADRRRGIGCDQVLLIHSSAEADAEMVVYNSDGSISDVCGNGARCVVALLAKALGRSHISLVSGKRIVRGQLDGKGLVSLDMGVPDLDWQDIPLSQCMDTLHLKLARQDKSGSLLSDPVAVGMGNPHVVFFVSDIDTIDLSSLGPGLETDPLFPQKTNVSIVSFDSRSSLRVRVWERGSGLTLACGSGACASLVAAVRRDYAEPSAKVHLPGGILDIIWKKSGNVTMTGTAEVAFEGVFEIAQKANEYGS